MKRVHKVALRSLTRIPSLKAVHKAVPYQLWLFVSYVQPLWLYTGICRMYTYKQSTQSVRYSLRSRFPDYWLIILISISFQIYYWGSSERKILEKSQTINIYIHHIMFKF